MQILRKTLYCWLPMACVWSLAAGLAVLLQHQVLRSQADEPQVQLAEDLAQRLAGGADPKSVLPAASVAIESSQAPFVAVYDAAGAGDRAGAHRQRRLRGRRPLAARSRAAQEAGAAAGTAGLGARPRRLPGACPAALGAA